MIDLTISQMIKVKNVKLKTQNVQKLNTLDVNYRFSALAINRKICNKTVVFSLFDAFRIVTTVKFGQRIHAQYTKIYIFMTLMYKSQNDFCP